MWIGLFRSWFLNLLALLRVWPAAQERFVGFHTMRGISVRPEVVGPHIGGNVWFPPSHRESLLRLAPVQL